MNAISILNGMHQSIGTLGRYYAELPLARQQKSDAFWNDVRDIMVEGFGYFEQFNIPYISTRWKELSLRPTNLKKLSDFFEEAAEALNVSSLWPARYPESIVNGGRTDHAGPRIFPIGPTRKAG